MDEYLDLVDANDGVIGRKLRSEVYAEGLSNFRSVCAFIINSEGKLWIPRRTASKSIFPSCLDMSMAGHVESGEVYDQTFKRELQEELNIDADSIDWKLIGHLTPQADGISSYMNIYEIRSDTAPDYNPDDFVEYFWLSPNELLEKLENGDKSKSDLPKLIRRFYAVSP